MRRARRLALAIAAGLLIAPHSAAHADSKPDVSAGENEFDVGLKDLASGGGDALEAASSSTVSYSHEPVCARGEGTVGSAFYGCGLQASCGTDGLLFTVWATTPDGTTSPTGTFCSQSGEITPTDVLTPDRILEAFESIPLPEAPLEVQPPGGVTLVNFDTILHTDAEPFTETVQLLNRQITFDIEPSEFTWTLGDGRTLTTTDPGRAWRAGLPMNEYVSHRYAKAGTVQLQLITTWSARWRLPNGPWRPVAGTVEITSPPQQLEVTTARPQLVSYD